MRLAVLDLGLDSLHLAVVEASGHGAGARITARRSWSETVRLAISAPDGHRIAAAALVRGLAAVERLLCDLAAFDAACPVVAIASAGLGAAAGGRPLCEEIERCHGIPIDRLSGDEQARLSYLGARSCLAAADRLAVAELGATSLELATGAVACDLVYSAPLGVLNTPSVRPSGRPPLADELELRPPGTDELDLSVLARLADVLAQFRPIELPAIGVDEARSDTIAVGAVVLHTVMELLGMGSAVISPRGRREGAALLHLRGCQIPEVDRVHLAVT